MRTIACFCIVALFALPALSNTLSYQQWLQQFKAEAIAQGISQPLLERAFKGTAPNETIIRLDRKQPEGSITLNQYLANTVTQGRVKQGKQKLQQYRSLLTEIGNRYGVQPRFIIALWGIETSYGQVTGGFNIINALATLAYDGRRADFFRNELMEALQILQQGHIGLAQFKGSWAGAMGQSQFMPSTFIGYAQDYNGDGHKNIWTDQADVFASIANYLSKLGWRSDLTWGREVQLPSNFDAALADMTIKKSLTEWASLGITKSDGSALPDEADIYASIAIPNAGGRAFIVYENFDHLLSWNKSKYFATAVGTLADKIGN